MAQNTLIELLEIGCTAEKLIETVNKLIAIYNNNEYNRTVSYNDLTDKPTINNIELSGAQTTQSLGMMLCDAIDATDFVDTFATKEEVKNVTSVATQEAARVAESKLETKLNADLSNIEAVDAFSGEAFIPVVTKNGTKKTTLNNIAAFNDVRAAAQRQKIEIEMNSDKVLPLAGVQDGRNVVFNVKSGYKLGTSSLYFNGQLLTARLDYEETDTFTITLLTYIPTNEDVLIFRATSL